MVLLLIKSSWTEPDWIFFFFFSFRRRLWVEWILTEVWKQGDVIFSSYIGGQWIMKIHPHPIQRGLQHTHTLLQSQKPLRSDHLERICTGSGPTPAQTWKSLPFFFYHYLNIDTCVSPQLLSRGGQWTPQLYWNQLLSHIREAFCFCFFFPPPSHKVFMLSEQDGQSVRKDLWQQGDENIDAWTWCRR